MHQNVCIYFSDTGGGHRSAADALEAGIREVALGRNMRPDVLIIKDNVAEKSHPLNRAFVEIYNYLLRHHQPLMKYYYGFVHAIKPESGFNLQLTSDYFCKLLIRDQPSVVVSAHPMIGHCIGHAMKRIGLKEKAKLIVVVTDPNTDLWTAWACPDADLTIAPNKATYDRLVEFGLDPAKIQMLGMPIHPDFTKPPSVTKEAFLNHLGLDPNVLTVCINAGWAGGGNMLKVYQSLAKVKRPVQALFLCGNNNRLYTQAMIAAADSNVPTAVLPFHDCMSDMMSAVDLMITKAGGLTTYQAVARRLPVAFDVITEPMPQERGTVDMLVKEKLGWALDNPEQVIELVENFQVNPERASSSLTGAFNFNLTDSAIYNMANQILDSCNPSIVYSAVEGQETSTCDLSPKSLVWRTAEET